MALLMGSALVMGSAAGRTRLHAEDDLRVLWLSAGRSELAVSVEGLWLCKGRRESDLRWHEVQQVQAVEATGLRRGSVRIEVFRTDGGVQVLGPFARAPAERWLQACGDAAREHGEQPLPLEGATGFALAQ